MTPIPCGEARDLAADLLDGSLSPSSERVLKDHVSDCLTCPALYRALMQLHWVLAGERERRGTA